MAKKGKGPLVPAANNNNMELDKLRDLLNSFAGTEANGVSLSLMTKSMKADYGIDLHAIAGANGFSSVVEMLHDDDLSSHIVLSGSSGNITVHAVTNESTEKHMAVIKATKKKKAPPKKRGGQRPWHKPHFGNAKSHHTSMSYSNAGRNGFNNGASSSKPFHLPASKSAFSSFGSKQAPAVPPRKSVASSTKPALPVITTKKFTVPKVPANPLAESWDTGYQSSSSKPASSTKSSLASMFEQPSTFMASMTGFSQSCAGRNGASAQPSTPQPAPKPVSVPQRRFTVPKTAEPSQNSNSSVLSSSTTYSIGSRGQSSINGKRVVQVDEFDKENITVQPVNNRDTFNGVNGFSSSYDVSIFNSNKSAPAATTASKAPSKPVGGRFTKPIDPSVSSSKEKLPTERELNADPRRPTLSVSRESSFWGSSSASSTKNHFPSPLLWNKAFADVTNQANAEAAKACKPQVTAPIFVGPDRSAFQPTITIINSKPTVQMTPIEELSAQMEAPSFSLGGIDDVLAEALNAELPEGCDFSDEEEEEDATPDPNDRLRLMNVIAEYGGHLYADVFLYEFYEMFRREMTTADFRDIFNSVVPDVESGFKKNFIHSVQHDRLVLMHPNPYCTDKRVAKNWHKLYDVLVQSAGQYVSIPDDVAQQFGFQDFREIYFIAMRHPVWNKVFKFVPNAIMLERAEVPAPTHVSVHRRK